MTDPGDLANTDANTAEPIPAAKPETINPGIGEEGLKEVQQDNAKKQSEVTSTNPDPLSL
ncbi:hypothetical protein ACFP81_11175 [Deinococcus lacus]|uniref:Uncharacterized protein n=1 Tax=Deinococcus lacus TaxID=392561 RepID=A0ABW1YDT1_9DEIO